MKSPDFLEGVRRYVGRLTRHDRMMVMLQFRLLNEYFDLQQGCLMVGMGPGCVSYWHTQGFI